MFQIGGIQSGERVALFRGAWPRALLEVELNACRRLWHRVVSTVLDYIADDMTNQAAAVAFYAMSSLFPGLLLLLTALSFFVGDQAQATMAQVMHTYIPIPRLREYVLENFHATLVMSGPMGVVGLVGLLWASKSVFMSLESGLATAWHQPRRDSEWWLHVKSVGMVLLIFVVMSAQFTFTSFTSVLAAYRIPLWGVDVYLMLYLSRAMGWVLSPLMVFATFSILYKVTPSQRLHMRDIIPGAAFAAIAFKIVEYCFILYITSVARLSALYGVIWIVLALLLWCYLSANIFFFGAKFIYVGLCPEPRPSAETVVAP